MTQKILLAGMVLLLVAAIAIISFVGNDSTSITGLLTYEAQKPIQDASSAYIITPALELNLNYSMAEFEQVVALARNLVDSCATQDSSTLKSCIDAELSTQEGWDFELVGTIAKFEVKSTYLLPYYNETTKKIERKEPVYRFAIDFSS